MSVLSELRGKLGRVVSPLDAAALAPETAVATVRDFAAIERLAAAGKLLALHRVVESGAWKAEGARSEVHWLAKETGVSFGHARSLVEAAAAVAATLNVEAAVRAGSLSESQVRELAPAVAADLTASDELLESAKTEAFGKLKERCARVRNAAADDDERYRRIKADRSLRTFQDPSGAGRIEASGPPEIVARLRAKLEPYRELAFKQARAEGRTERADAYNWDALVLWLADEEARDASQPGCKPKRPRRNPAAQVIVLADLSGLARGHTVPGETCEIVGFGPVPVEAIRELIGDAALRIVLKDGVDIRTIAHSKRTINQIIQTALLANGWACDNPDCPHRHRLERDHVQALTNGGMTEFFNLRPLCKSGCHQAKTDDDMRERERRRRRSRSP